MGEVPFTAPKEVQALLPGREADSHKGSHGHVLLIAGSRGMAGAAVFAGTAALRSGAGLVSAVLPKELYPVVASRVPEVIGLCAEDGAFGCLGGENAAEAAAFAEGKDSLAIGPGLSSGGRAESFLETFLKLKPDLPQLWDADALNILARRPDLWRYAPGRCLITPHPGEMARLCGVSVSEVQKSRVKTALSFARLKKVTVLLKGHNTVIASPDGELSVNPTGHPAMGSAGMGDVLAGAAAAFLAQGLTPYKAAVCAAYIHGLAGELAVSALRSDRGLLASDAAAKLPEAIGLLLKEVGR
jgi:NAD(P)H-hydrate epimerase